MLLILTTSRKHNATLDYIYIYTPDYPYNELLGKGKKDSLYPGFVIQNIIDQIFL